MRNLSLILCTSMLLAACGGEFSYKRGASPADLEKTKAMCKAQGSEAQINKCLEENGWVVQKLDDMDLFPVTAKFENVYDTQISATQTPASKAPAAATAAAANATKANTSSAATSSPPANNSSAPTAATPTVSAPANPLDTFVISSWWKLGVMGDALQTDTDACVATLGEAHRPNSKTQTASRGFIVCMRDKGWRALRAVK